MRYRQNCWEGLQRGVNSAHICPTALLHSSWLSLRCDYTAAEMVSKPQWKDQENDTDLSSDSSEPLNSHLQPRSIFPSRERKKTTLNRLMRPFLLFLLCTAKRISDAVNSCKYKRSSITTHFITSLHYGFLTTWKVLFMFTRHLLPSRCSKMVSE